MATATGCRSRCERGLVSIGQIDTAVRRVLRLKEQLGLFEDPYGRCQTHESAARVARRRAAGAQRRRPVPGVAQE